MMLRTRMYEESQKNARLSRACVTTTNIQKSITKRERERREEREGMRDKSLWSMCVATSHAPDSQSFIDSVIVWPERIHVAQLTARYARKFA